MRHAVILAFDPGEALRPLTSEETPTAFLALGEGNFERAILTALACGYNTDCAVGQAATLLGVVFGASRLHDTWRAPIGEALDTHVIGFERINSDCPPTGRHAAERRLRQIGLCSAVQTDGSGSR